MTDKQKLENRIKKLDELVTPMKKKLNEIRNLEREAHKKAMIGKCFVYRSKYHSYPKTRANRWDVYYQVKGIAEYGVVALVFRKDSYNRISIYEEELLVYDAVRNPNDLPQITEKEFYKNYDAILKELGLKRVD
jgi:hypothetical protein